VERAAVGRYGLDALDEVEAGDDGLDELHGVLL
jgi:hypothetical protein